MTCMESRCCENPLHTCFRKRGVRGSPYGYAACRETCPDDGEWDCEVLLRPDPSPPAALAMPPEPPNLLPRLPTPPSPPPCSLRYKTCWDTHCCLSPLDGCFRRRGKQFAMCKPLPSGGIMFCDREDESWECPGWDIPPPLPPEPPRISPFPYPPPSSPSTPPSHHRASYAPPLPFMPRLTSLDFVESAGAGKQMAVVQAEHVGKAHVRKLSWLVVVLALVALLVCVFGVVATFCLVCCGRSSQPHGPGVSSGKRRRMVQAVFSQGRLHFGRPRRALYTRKMDQEMGQAEPNTVCQLELQDVATGPEEQEGDRGHSGKPTLGTAAAPAEVEVSVPQNLDDVLRGLSAVARELDTRSLRTTQQLQPAFEYDKDDDI